MGRRQVMTARVVVGLVALATVAAADGQVEFDRIQPLSAAASAPAPVAPPMGDPALASAIAQWKAVGATDLLPFDTYASFLAAHPGWPGEAGARRAAEKQASTGSDAGVVAFFTHYPPQTAAGGVRFALALAALGRRGEAEAAARTAWRRGAMAPTDEATILDTFGPGLRPADHDARMDALLWGGGGQAATRQLLLVSPAARDLFAARLALRNDAPEAPTFATAANPPWEREAGFVADRAVWLRDHGSGAAARASLARPHLFAAPPGDRTRWYQVMLGLARGAVADGDWQQAYDIARQVDDALPPGADVGALSYAERDAYTDLVWLAGQSAMRHLARPADAAPLFERYSGGSRSPSIRSKGLYWAGRATASAGQADRARTYFTRAATLRDQYYGQLAAERLGQPLAAPAPFVARPVDGATRSAFEGRQTVQAVRFLGRIGDWQDQTAFVRQIAQDATTDADHVLADELSRSIGRPDLAVMVGRSALQNGLPDYSLIGFPTVPLSADVAANWSMIHAIARQESQFDRQATSRTGARGLMQLMPGTARGEADKLGLGWNPALLTDPAYNVSLGASYFDRIYTQFGSFPLAVAAYNAGPGNVNKWLAANGDPRAGAIDPVDWVEAIPFSETRNYVQRVLENAVVYDLAYPAHSRSQGSARLSWYLGRRPG
ncbi:MAG: transglycosylase SLT domain-containing protein [Janthinobacterium lividum]